MTKKTIPAWILNPLIVRLIKSNMGIILSYWIFQGVLYMDVREKIFKITLDVILSLFFYLMGLHLVIAVFIAHTANMFLNGHYFVLKHNMGKINNKPSEFLKYIEKLYDRLLKVNFFLGVAGYGSLSRNDFSSNSDFDIRVFPKGDFISWTKTLIWILKERSRAFIHAFPLDVYAFNLGVIDSKMRADEPPIILLDPENVLTRKYGDYILFKDFATDFRAKHVREK